VWLQLETDLDDIQGRNDEAENVLGACPTCP
jgi:hypothetical protein